MSDLETEGFWPEIVRLKDELPLSDLAKRFRTTPGAISAALERTGATDTALDDGDLPPEAGGEDDDEEMLPEVRRALQSLRPGSKDAMIGHHAMLLGQVPDADVAKAAGVSIRTIASFRARHEIPGYSGPRRKPEPAGLRRSRIDPYAHLLGKMPDQVIAEKAGVTVHAVRSFRAKHAGDGHAESSLAAVPVYGGSQAWRVSWRAGAVRRDAVLLADDLQHALRNAETAGLGEIVGLELLGPVLDV